MSQQEEVKTSADPFANAIAQYLGEHGTFDPVDPAASEAMAAEVADSDEPPAQVTKKTPVKSLPPNTDTQYVEGRDGKKRRIARTRIWMMAFQFDEARNSWTGFTEEELKLIESGDVNNIVPLIFSRLGAIGVTPAVVEGLYAITHHSDFIMDKGEKVPKVKHFHILVKFIANSGMYPTDWECTGIPTHMFNKFEEGGPKNAWDNGLAYLIHAKQLWKFQYQPQEVITFYGENYMDIYERRAWQWQRRAKVAMQKHLKEGDEELQLIGADDLIAGAASGEYDMHTIMLDNHLFRVYNTSSKVRREVDAAIKAHEERAQYLKTQELMDGIGNTFQTASVYIQGKSRLGKTTISKEIINRWSIAARIAQPGINITANLDTPNHRAYEKMAGHDIVYIDEMTEFAFPPESYLTILDPNNSSAVDARNKATEPVANRLVVMSSTKDLPDTLNKLASAKAREDSVSDTVDATEFYRRIGYVIELSSVVLPLGNGESRTVPTAVVYKSVDRRTPQWVGNDKLQFGGRTRKIVSDYGYEPITEPVVVNEHFANYVAEVLSYHSPDIFLGKKTRSFFPPAMERPEGVPQVPERAELVTTPLLTPVRAIEA